MRAMRATNADKRVELMMLDVLEPVEVFLLHADLSVSAFVGGDEHELHQLSV